MDKYTKDEIFKNIGFRGVVEIKDKAEDNYDSYAYEKAGLWKNLIILLLLVCPKNFSD